MPQPGFEPGFLRPQRTVLTTRWLRLLVLYNLFTHLYLTWDRTSEPCGFPTRAHSLFLKRKRKRRTRFERSTLGFEVWQPTNSSASHLVVQLSSIKLVLRSQSHWLLFYRQTTFRLWRHIPAHYCLNCFTVTSPPTIVVLPTNNASPMTSHPHPLLLFYWQTTLRVWRHIPTHYCLNCFTDTHPHFSTQTHTIYPLLTHTHSPTHTYTQTHTIYI